MMCEVGNWVITGKSKVETEYDITDVMDECNLKWISQISA